MAEKRIFGRFKRRLPLRFGKGSLDVRGNSGNISATGLLVHANRVFPKGSVLAIEISLPSGIVCSSEVQVAWAREAPPGTQGIVLGAMGVRFMGAPPEAYYGFLVECDRIESRNKPAGE